VREQHDPIETFGRHLMDRGIVTADQLKAIDKEVKSIVLNAAEFASSEPEPDPSELYTDVLA
jgi:pyruvate dehydrogenase E1 component alpha subunit